jgi:hypothetical protein
LGEEQISSLKKDKKALMEHFGGYESLDEHEILINSVLITMVCASALGKYTFFIKNESSYWSEKKRVNQFEPRRC